jgi:hypothetical protein
MDDSSSNTFQTLASVLAGGLAGYVDAQNSQPVAVVAPTPQTAFGFAGAGQATPSGLTGTLTGSPAMLLLVGALVIYFVMKK